MLDRVRASSCMAPIADPLVAAVCHELEQKLGLPCQFVADLSWQAREAAFDRGEIDLMWICGLPYVWKADRSDPPIELVAAPVMEASRYRGQAVYYSDVIVPAASSVEEFADLRGCTWSYNEPASHSGYNVVRSHLAQSGLGWDFFGKVVEAGSHERSLDLVRKGRVDACAIDSTVLEAVRDNVPGLMDEIRVVDTLGPSPMPPWVAHTSLGTERTRALRKAFLGLADDPLSRQLLSRWGVAGFAAVEDRDYDPIRSMEESSRGLGRPANVVQPEALKLGGMTLNDRG